MSDVAEEAMDSSAVSDEEVEDQQETSQDHQSSPNKSLSKVSGKGKGRVYSLCSSNKNTRGGRCHVYSGDPVSISVADCRFHSHVVAAVGEIIEGKRAKKTVERLDFQAPKQKEKLKIGDGKYLAMTDAALFCFRSIRLLDISHRKMSYPGIYRYVYVPIFSGSGEKLGDIPRTGYQITKMKPADLKPLHAILFDRPGKVGDDRRLLAQV